MVIHLSNYIHFFKNDSMLVALISEYQNSEKNANQQIINHRRHAIHSPLVQQPIQGDPEKKDSKA
ncbi:MAG: hypothetical protein JWN42_1159 [Candidatus Angelobacter sp.]|nr:hypothetical protein [Candidatus Angelobacter sp.]